MHGFQQRQPVARGRRAAQARPAPPAPPAPDHRAADVLTDEDRAWAERVVAEGAAYQPEVEAAQAAGTYVYNEDVEDEEEEEEETVTPWVSVTRSWVPGRRGRRAAAAADT